MTRTRRAGRPLKADVVPAAEIEAVYRDETVPMRVHAERLGIAPASISQRAARMGLPQRRWVRLPLGAARGAT